MPDESGASDCWQSRPILVMAGYAELRADADDRQEAGPVDLPELFRRHQAELLRLAVLIVRDVPTAEDVVQDVFTRLHARGHRAGDLE
jgi:DNA-directed RNA polymerase specialized sigma24 family protein